LSDESAGPGAPRRRFPWAGLIALLVIAGVVVAVLIPAYGDYTHRSQASEAISLLGGAKLPLAEYFQDQRKWPERLDQVVEHSSGKFTQSVVISKGAGGTGEIELTATMRTEGVDRRVRGQTVRMLSADGGRTWICRPGTMPDKNLPSACRAGN
jgi:type IV pilus assembly protein PilA